MSEDLFASHVSYSDRSTAEKFARCPMQARLEELHPQSVGTPANVGNEGHAAISRTISSYVDSAGIVNRRDIAEELLANLRNSRPDVQPEVLKAFPPHFAYEFAKMLVYLHVDAILRWDGGPGERTGQIATAFENGLGITSELDLLHATPSKELLREHDWKSGWAFHTVDSVYGSFQFNTHAVLAFAQYPDANLLEVCVWNTRQGSRLAPVMFERKFLSNYRSHVLGALSTQAQYEHAPLETVPTWPAAEKCRICPVAMHCPAADMDLKADPADLVSSLCAVDAKQKQLTNILKAHVKKTGKDIVAPNGMRFGKDKPTKRRETWQAYSTGSDEPESEE